MSIRNRKPLHKNAELVFSAISKDNPRSSIQRKGRSKVKQLLKAMFGKKEECYLVD